MTHDGKALFSVACHNIRSNDYIIDYIINKRCPMNRYRKKATLDIKKK
jgi:hypothetical protein